jgi:hypothetical protein
MWFEKTFLPCKWSEMGIPFSKFSPRASADVHALLCTFGKAFNTPSKNGETAEKLELKYIQHFYT